MKQAAELAVIATVVVGVVGGLIYVVNRSKMDQDTLNAVVELEDTVIEGFNCDGIAYDQDDSYLLKLDDTAEISVRAANITPIIVINDSFCVNRIGKMPPGEYKYSIGWDIDSSREGIAETEILASKNIARGIQEGELFSEEEGIQLLNVEEEAEFGMTSGGLGKQTIDNSENCDHIERLDSFSYGSGNYRTIQISPDERFKFEMTLDYPPSGNHFVLAQNLEDGSFHCGNTLDSGEPTLSLSEGNYKLWVTYDLQPSLHRIETEAISAVAQNSLQLPSTAGEVIRCSNDSIEGEPESVAFTEGTYEIWIGELLEPSRVLITQESSSQGVINSKESTSGGDEILPSADNCSQVAYEEDNAHEVKVDDLLTFRVAPDHERSDIAIIYKSLNQ